MTSTHVYSLEENPHGTRAAAWAESCKGLDVYITSHSPTAGNH